MNYSFLPFSAYCRCEGYRDRIQTGQHSLRTAQPACMLEALGHCESCLEIRYTSAYGFIRGVNNLAKKLGIRHRLLGDLIVL